jgi:Ig-like domain-containing protein
MSHSSYGLRFGLFVGMVALSLLLAACNVPLPSGATQPTNPANPALTAAVQTLQALSTQPTSSTAETASPVPTFTPAVTNTSTNTAIAIPTTAIPTNTPVPPSPTPICNRAEFVKDVTVPDGTIYSPSVSFVKTWRLKNTGTCTWTTSYSLVFDHGQKMGSSGSQPDPVALATTVTPGQTVDVSITLVSPSLPGNYQADFRLRSNAGTLFGVGPSAQGTFWVKITVLPATSYP